MRSKISEAAAAMGKRGGPARAKALTAEQRRAIASQGGKARASTMTFEERSELARRAWKTKRRRKRARAKAKELIGRAVFDDAWAKQSGKLRKSRKK